MSKKRNKQKKVEPVSVLSKEELQPKKLDLSGKKTAVHELKYHIDTDASFFKDSAFGRTLSLRNKTGKSILTLLISIFTGFNLDIFNLNVTPEPMDYIQHILEIFAQSQDWVIITTSIILFVIPLIIGYLVHKGYLSQAMGNELKAIFNDVKEAKDPDSDGGKKITEKEALDLIKKVLARRGIDLDRDNKT